MAKKKEQVNEQVNEQLQQGQIIMVDVDDKGAKANIILKIPQGGATVTLYFKKYDDKLNDYVELEDKAKEQLDTILNGIKEQTGVEVKSASDVKSLMGQTVNVYHVSGEKSVDDRTSFLPIKEYEKFDRIDTLTNNVLDDSSDTYGMSLKSEFDGIRFNFGFNADILGADKRLRVSTLVIKPTDKSQPSYKVSTKYKTGEIQGYENQIERGEVDPSQIELVKDVIDQLTEKSRRRKVEELSELFGVNIDDVLDESSDVEINVPIKIKTQSLESGNDINYYLEAVISEEDLKK